MSLQVSNGEQQGLNIHLDLMLDQCGADRLLLSVRFIITKSDKFDVDCLARYFERQFLPPKDGTNGVMYKRLTIQLLFVVAFEHVIYLIKVTLLIDLSNL